MNGDIVIELEDGTEIVVPVDEEKVRAIRFGRTRKTRIEMDAGGDLPIQDSMSAGNVIPVGPNRAIKLPSEAAKLASDGDIIEINLPEKQIHLLISEEEMENRGKQLPQKANHPAPGLLAAYRNQVKGAEQGALWLY